MATGTDLALDLNPLSTAFKDIFPTGGDFAMVSDKDQIRQNLLQTLNVYLGEWYLDNTIGVDYYGTILVKNPDLAAINATLISTILGVAGVQSILSFNTKIDSEGRSLTVSFKAQTTDGIVSYAGTIP
jgi:hypothetical protein